MLCYCVSSTSYCLFIYTSNLFNSLYLSSETLNSLSYLLDDGYLVKQSILRLLIFYKTELGTVELELAICEQFSETVVNTYVQVSQQHDLYLKPRHLFKLTLACILSGSNFVDGLGFPSPSSSRPDRRQMANMSPSIRK